MKKLLLLLFALVVSIGNVWADKTIYLNPNKWYTGAGNEAFSVWVCGASDTSTNPDKFIALTAVAGTSCYQAVISDAYTKIVFVRHSYSAEANWNTNKFNQTDDITTFADKSLFTITYWHDGSDDGESNSSYSYNGGAHTLYSATFATGLEWEDVYAYAWTGDGANATKYLGDWPGTKMTATSETFTIDGTAKTKYSVSFLSTAAPANILFNKGEGGAVGVKQTANLTFTDGKLYVLPTANPTAPTDPETRVIAVFSKTYNKELTESNNGWGGGPDPKYTSFDFPVINDGHYVVHVNGTAVNGRASATLDADHSTLHVALWPKTATSCKIWDDNQYTNATNVTPLVPGQWNYVEIENVSFSTNYIGIELYDGETPETEFYLDHFYFAKPASGDATAPTFDTHTLKSTNCFSATLTLQATDETSETITYKVIDTATSTVYQTTGASGTAIDFTVSQLAASTDYIFSVVAIDENGNESAPETINASTTAIPDIPVADKLADNVKTVYGQYGSATGLSMTSGTVFSGMSRDVVRYKNNNAQFSLPADPKFDVSDMDYIHYDILSDVDTPVALFVENRNESWKGKDVDGGLIAGTWTSFDIPVSFFIDDCGQSMTNVINMALIKAVANKTGHDGFADFSSPFPTLYIANVYYWKNPIDDTEKPVMTKAEATTVKDTKVTLTVCATDNSNGTLTYTVKNGETELATGTGKAGEDATIEVTGLTPETTYNLSVIAKDANNNESTAMSVAEFTTEATPSVVGTSGTGITGTNGGGSAGLEYSYEFIEDATGVNVTFTCTNTANYTGLVSYIWNNTSGFTELGNGYESITKHLDYSVGTTIKVACKWAYAGGMSVTDYIEYELQGVTAATVPAAVGLYKWATFCSDKDLDFTGITDVKAYIVTGSENGAVITQQITGAVVAGTGMLLNSDEAGEFSIPVATGEVVDYSSTNKMHGITAETETVDKAEAGYTNYILTVREGKAAFAYVNNTSATLNKGQAYLTLEGDTPTSAPVLSIGGDGETTGIRFIDNSTLTNDNVYYDLSGRRVANPTKGLYIVNGKKVILK